GRVFANPRVADHLGEVIEMFLEQARLLPFEEFARNVRRWEALDDVDGSERAHQVSYRRRRATMFLDDTTMVLRASGGALDGAEMQEIFDRYQHAEYLDDWSAARAVHGDDTDGAAADLPRTAAQRAWDALRNIFRDAASTPPGSQPPEPVVNIVADTETYQEALRELAEQLATGDAAGTSDAWLGSRGADPRWWRSGTTAGVPLSRTALIEAILLGRVRRVVTDGAGVAVDVGRKRRFFTGPMRDAVMMLTGTCVFAGCSRPSGQCAADHTIDHQHGGHTSTHNGGPMCDFHNLTKNRGFTVWRDPHGYWHTYRPDGTEIH
ncbi:MAG: hypothetical protein JWN99_79, partial [Ilumatobacteraceae bacterium]|nr:hypothetical protein [Ilumatobacteraceae bacterium]